MNKYNYNFSGFEKAISHFKQTQSKSSLDEIKYELNKFFKDSNCQDVIFTKNTDNLFFGMTTYIIIDNTEVEEILVGTDPVRIHSYIIEIDSKLLDLGLKNRELVAILLHEVGHVVNDSTPTDQVKKAIDVYMAEAKDIISIDNGANYYSLIKFAIRDTIRKFTSIFTRNDEEILADEFVVMCGYGEDLESAYKKIVKSSLNINKNVSNKLLTLGWTLRIYKNMKMYRNIAIRTLNKSKAYTASVLEKKEIDLTIKDLKKIDPYSISEGRYCRTIVDKIVVENCYFNESSDSSSFLGRIRHKGLRGLEEDVYEYQMRVRNVEEKDEAINLMRQINSRMAVLDDYISTCKDISEKELKRWEKCLNKYDIVREELAKKTVYNKKNYGLWFDYNYIDDINR